MSKNRYKLYPDIEPYHSDCLNVSDLHEIYFEECGNPKGKPVIMVHGGPGGGSTPLMRRYHNPDLYRIILFDQRGCGRSNPYAEIRENTTWDLVADMEKIRTRLNIDKWQVFGGSWGSTLSLAYAQTHPDRVTELILRGIFLLRSFELEWFYQKGANYIFPDKFEPYESFIPKSERGNMIAAYHRRLTHSDQSIQLEAARRWSALEGGTVSLLLDDKREDEFSKDTFALAFSRIENHYFYNNGFFDHDNWLLEHADKIKNIPGKIIHGRYDIITPLINAWDLSRVWQKAEFRIIPDSGHAMTEPGIIHELIRATTQFSY